MAIHTAAIVVRDNRYGLSRDAEILRKGIESAGIPAVVLDRWERKFTDRLRRRKVADTLIHIERIHPAWLGGRETNILIPNQERFPERHLRRLRRIDRVLAKTHHAREIFSGFGAHSAYLGFTSTDRLVPSIPKDWRRFLHLAGGSTLKGTEDVLALWRAHPEWPELVVVQKRANAPGSVPSNVTLLSGYLADHHLKSLQNSCGVHLCPSRSEGWGHHIVEALSCGAAVVTTDAPPMNEHVTTGCGVLVPAGRSEPRHLGRNFFVDRPALEAAIARLVAQPPAFAQDIGARARTRFEEIDRNFAARLRGAFGQSGSAESEEHGHQLSSPIAAGH